MHDSKSGGKSVSNVIMRTHGSYYCYTGGKSPRKELSEFVEAFEFLFYSTYIFSKHPLEQMKFISTSICTFVPLIFFFFFKRPNDEGVIEQPVARSYVPSLHIPGVHARSNVTLRSLDLDNAVTGVNELIQVCFFFSLQLSFDSLSTHCM